VVLLFTIGEGPSPLHTHIASPGVYQAHGQPHSVMLVHTRGTPTHIVPSDVEPCHFDGGRRGAAVSPIDHHWLHRVARELPRAHRQAQQTKQNSTVPYTVLYCRALSCIEVVCCKDALLVTLHTTVLGMGLVSCQRYTREAETGLKQSCRSCSKGWKSLGSKIQH